MNLFDLANVSDLFTFQSKGQAGVKPSCALDCGRRRNRYEHIPADKGGNKEIDVVLINYVFHHHGVPASGSLKHDRESPSEFQILKSSVTYSRASFNIALCSNDKPYMH